MEVFLVFLWFIFVCMILEAGGNIYAGNWNPQQHKMWRLGFLIRKTGIARTLVASGCSL
jgi:hypothetical protein